MGKLALRGLVLAAVIALLGVGSYAIAGGGTKNFDGQPADGLPGELRHLSTPAIGSFEARLSNDGESITYELSYSGLEGVVTQAHVHFATEGAQRRHLVLALRDRGEPVCGVAASDAVLPAPGGTVRVRSRRQR